MFDPGRTTEVKVDGKTWTIGRLERSVIFQLRDYIREQIGDPFASVDRLKGILPPDELLKRVRDAEATAKDLAQFSLGTATAKAFLSTELGITKLIHLLLLPHHPNATEDDAFRVVLAMKDGEIGKALARAAGEAPLGNGAVPATAGSIGSH